MIITIGGNLGAGKTTLAARLVQSLGYEELYMGGIFRQLAFEQGFTIEEFYARLKNNPQVERDADKRQEQLMREKDNLVVQGRIAWYFAKKSPFKKLNVFLAVDEKIGTERTAKRPENATRSIDELAKANVLRAKREQERYRSLYGIENFLDPSHYDFVLDTSALTEDEVFQKTMDEIKKRQTSDA